MAAIGAAAPLPPPIAAEVQPALSPQQWVFLPANSTLVTHTPAVWWDPAPPGAGGVARVAIPAHRAFRLFGPPLRVGSNPVDVAAARQQNLLGLSLSAAAWSRVLTAVQLALTPRFAVAAITADEQMDNVLAAITFHPTADLELLAPDWDPGQGHNPPGGNGAVAVAARQSLAIFRFLSLTSPFALEMEGPLPWTAVSMVLGALGSCGTQTVRLPEMGDVRALADFYVGLFGVTASDARRAHVFAHLVQSHILPMGLRRPVFDPDQLLKELEDGAHYRSGSAGAAAVEERRIFLLAHGCVPPFSHCAVACWCYAQPDCWARTHSSTYCPPYPSPAH